jgi:hypothetical protein
MKKRLRSRKTPLKGFKKEYQNLKVMRKKQLKSCKRWIKV